MQIRRARRGDAREIESLYRALVPGDDNIHVDARRIEALESDPTNVVLVAQTEEGVCGTAFLTICLDAMYGFNPYGVVENIVIDGSMQGKGIGRALIAAVEAEARAAQCTKLMLLSAVQRTDAHRFFARLGFDGERKRGFVKYLNSTPVLRLPA